MTYDEYSSHDCTLSEEDSCSVCHKWFLQQEHYLTEAHMDAEEIAQQEARELTGEYVF